MMLYSLFYYHSQNNFYVNKYCLDVQHSDTVFDHENQTGEVVLDLAARTCLPIGILPKCCRVNEALVAGNSKEGGRSRCQASNKSFMSLKYMKLASIEERFNEGFKQTDMDDHSLHIDECTNFCTAHVCYSVRSYCIDFLDEKPVAFLQKTIHKSKHCSNIRRKGEACNTKALLEDKLSLRTHYFNPLPLVNTNKEAYWWW